ncbi:M15 family metallopeptidase [Candidatus Falkowbacteria bacterium]|nr:M15 family metallopeptidase [Candidatus Falkowbacteria bacterium]
MKVLQLKSKGALVRRWQYFLIGQGILKDTADGIFGPITESATKSFQRKYNLVADGIVGQLTYAKAMQLGFPVVEEPKLVPKRDYYWMPSKPNFNPLVTNTERQKIFGKYSYIILAKDNIRITDNWQKENIEKTSIPQLIGIKEAPSSGNIYFHKLAAKQLQALFTAWEREGLIKLILDWGGSFVPRMVRGSNTVLSNHAFGTAFDINVPSNWIGTIPAHIGEKGCLRELIPLANKFGFYWGGHYPRRLDGMHFEVAKLIEL